MKLFKNAQKSQQEFTKSLLEEQGKTDAAERETIWEFLLKLGEIYFKMFFRKIPVI